MRLDTWPMALLVFTFVVMGGVLIYANVIDTYDINTTTTAEGANFTDVYYTINESYTTSQQMKNHTLGGSVESGSDSWESMAKGSYSAIRLVTGSFTLIGDIMDAIAGQLGIPTWIINIGMVAILISIVFALIYLIFRVA